MVKTEIEKIKKANERFYQAFESLTIGEMEHVWKQSDEAQCIHPGWEALSGWKLVRTSWERIFRGTQFMKIYITDVKITLHESLAWVVCTENISSAQQDRYIESTVLATNIYEKNDGRWLMIHHHGSPVFSRTAVQEPSKPAHLN
jgi:ketosteroid isomerase-like protein